MFDYYRLLDISENSTLDEIKRAYRKAVFKYHPDHNNNSDNSSAFFILVRNAYEVLMNKDRKSAYDQYQKNHACGSVGQASKEISVAEIHDASRILFDNALNSIFWDIEDLLHKARKTRNRTYTRKLLEADVLRLLFFIEKWVLIPAGLKDYFMDARQLPEIGLGAYLDNIINHRVSFSHFPYTTVENYFFNVRVRLNKFLANYHKLDLSQVIHRTDIRLMDSLANAHDFSMDYINKINQAVDNDTIIECKHAFSNKCFYE